MEATIVGQLARARAGDPFACDNGDSPRSGTVPGGTVPGGTVPGGAVPGGAGTGGARAAILFVDGAALSYDDLLRRIAHLRRRLGEMGLTPRDRVACILPGGPDAAAAILATLCWAECVPLSPQLPLSEIVAGLAALDVKAAIAPQPLLAALGAAGGIAMLASEDLADPPDDAAVAEDAEALRPWAGPDRTALVVRTSGTTSGPKVIRLSEARLLMAAANMQRIFALSGGDRCFCPMPLYHTHGLITGVLSALCSGGSIVCPPEFAAARLFDQLERTGPSWISAVPAMYQAALAAAERDAARPIAGLRFVRSSSAPLPASLVPRIEALFGAPLIETYGITEASVVASNPLPPGRRKPGSVGLPTGVEIRLVASASSAAADGEIWVRGPIVIDGYEDNPEADRAGFADGWFRTGDLGRFDEDGYLFITGRTGDAVKRGANLVSLVEIDSALVALPHVVDAAAYSVPHPTLGIDLRAAIVIEAGSGPSVQELRRMLLASLPGYKVPSRIDAVASIPRTATGKILRGVLAESLRRTEPAAAAAPATATEISLAGYWKAFFQCDEASLSDDFFSSGGDSLRLVDFIEGVAERFGVELDIEAILNGPRLDQIAGSIDELSGASDRIMTAAG